MGRQFPVMRGIAILFVLLNHSISMSLWMVDRFQYHPPSQFVLVILVILKQFGLVAVPIFLFLSGAFFSYAAQNRPISGAYRTVKSNVLNVLWPYVIWSLVFYLVNYLLLGVTSTPSQYLKNLMVGYPFNFIPLLIFFYLTAPLISLLNRRFPVLVLTGVFLIQLLEAVLVDPNTFGFPIHVPNWMNYLAMPVIRTEFMQWGILFPLGMVYQQYTQEISKFFKDKSVYLVLLAGLFFGLDVLYELRAIVLPLAGILCPLFMMLLTPVIRREMFPAFQQLERIGKRSYGLYLTNLIVITSILMGIRQVFPWLIEQQLLLIPILFSLAFVLLWFFMSFWERPPQRMIYRYLFG